jgi:hypothetical protein
MRGLMYDIVDEKILQTQLKGIQNNKTDIANYRPERTTEKK